MSSTPNPTCTAGMIRLAPAPNRSRPKPSPTMPAASGQAVLHPLLHGRRRQLPPQGVWEFSPTGLAACVESDPAEPGQPPHSGWPGVPPTAPAGQHAGAAVCGEPLPPRPATRETSPTPRAAKMTIAKISVLSQRRPPGGAPQPQSAAEPLEPLPLSAPPPQRGTPGLPSPHFDSISSSMLHRHFVSAGRQEEGPRNAERPPNPFPRV